MNVTQPANPHDPDQIHPDLPSDLEFWSDELCISIDFLKEVIARHGTDVVELRSILEK